MESEGDRDRRTTPAVADFVRKSFPRIGDPELFVKRRTLDLEELLEQVTCQLRQRSGWSASLSLRRTRLMKITTLLRLAIHLRMVFERLSGENNTSFSRSAR
jgi:hypothetical protein